MLNELIAFLAKHDDLKEYGNTDYAVFNRIVANVSADSATADEISLCLNLIKANPGLGRKRATLLHLIESYGRK